MVAALMFIAGCTFTREVEVRQGNESLPDYINEVVGKDATEVRSILGPPQSRWNIDGEIWIYYYRSKGRDRDVRFSAELLFDDDGRVSEVRINEDTLGG